MNRSDVDNIDHKKEGKKVAAEHKKQSVTE